MKYEIRCGGCKGMVEAETPGEAWRKLTVGKIYAFAPLAAIRTRPHGFWRYSVPETLDNAK